MEVHFLNQYPCMPSCPGIIQFGIFWLMPWVNWRVFSPSVLLRNLSVFLCCLSVRLFCYVLFVPYFVPKLLFHGYPIVDICLCIHSVLADNIFFVGFGMSCFVCIVLPSFYIFFVFLLLPVPSGLFPQLVLFILLVELFLNFSTQQGFSVLPLSDLFCLFS